MRSSCWSRRTGARREQVFIHGIIPVVASPDRALRARREHPLVGSRSGLSALAGSVFELLLAMSLFQYPPISLLLIVASVIVIAAERLSALLRARLG
jgi:hypothetical protein